MPGIAAEVYTVQAYTHADKRKRPLAEAKKYAIEQAKKMPGVLQVACGDATEYSKERDVYLFSMDLVMVNPPEVSN